MNRELYAEKFNHDVRAAELQARGYQVRRSSVRNQQLHPMYVEDRKAGLSDMNKGFGNTIYKTFFAVLYEVSWNLPEPVKHDHD